MLYLVNYLKVHIERDKRGSSNRHYVILDRNVSGTIYVKNIVADKYPDVKEFEIELPFEINEEEE